MDRWIEIRRRVLSEEISKRQACREYELHWKTLQKVLQQPLPPERRASGPQRPSKLDRFGPVIREILDADRAVHRKQRHTAWRIFERLRDEHGYDGGYTIVKQAVRELKLSRKEVFLPLRHDPGEAQVDFGYAYVDLAGERQQLAVFVLSLPYCDAVHCRAFPRECTEVFLEGHRRAFQFFGGVPRRISYDNTKVAVAKIVGSRERQQTREFQRLVGHYLFQPHFCLVGRPNEKGHVERLLDYGRRRCLVPIPKVASLGELNQRLEAWCRRDLQQTARRQVLPKQARLAEDQQAFLPIPGQDFEARRLVPGMADSLSLVHFDRNAYSVPTAYAHRDVTVVAGIEELRIVHGDRLIARHRRCWGRDQTLYEPIHYLALLERKPGGLDFAKPLEGWNLPVCFGILRRQLEADLGSRGTREFIQVLRLLERQALPTLTAAVQDALELGAVSADAVRLIVEARQEPPIGLFSLEGRPQLKLVRVDRTDVAAYQSLLAASARTEVSP